MEKFNLRAKFYPANEPVNGFIGYATIFASDVIKLRGISVFENAEGPGHHIQFPSFGEDNVSYVVPHNKDAYAQFLDVVEKAIESENHFAFAGGKRNLKLEVSGKAVTEPHADGRFSLKVDNLCTIYGISTERVSYEKDGEQRAFTSVRVPNLRPYEKDGETVYTPIFEGLSTSWKDKEGQERHLDYSQMIAVMVKSERKKLLEKPPLDNQIQGAAGKAGQEAPTKDAPGKEATR